MSSTVSDSLVELARIKNTQALFNALNKALFGDTTTQPAEINPDDCDHEGAYCFDYAPDTGSDWECPTCKHTWRNAGSTYDY